MKKILILSLILLSIFLTSCWNEDETSDIWIIIEGEATSIDDIDIFNN